VCVCCLKATVGLYGSCPRGWQNKIIFFFKIKKGDCSFRQVDCSANIFNQTSNNERRAKKSIDSVFFLNGRKSQKPQPSRLIDVIDTKCRTLGPKSVVQVLGTKHKISNIPQEAFDNNASDITSYCYNMYDFTD